MDMEAQIAIVGGAIYLVTGAAKKTWPDFFASALGDRILGWLPLALGAVLGVLLWLTTDDWSKQGVIRSLLSGVGAGGSATLLWEAYRAGLRSKIAAITGKANHKGKGHRE